MKCRKCGGAAVINMRQHKLALCAEDYLAWLPEQVQRSIEKYEMFSPADKVLVAVSGGKDSLGLWDILARLGYQADGLYIGLGIHGGFGYSDQSRALSQAFAGARGLKLHIVEVEAAYGATIPELAVISNRGHGRPCSVCGLNKRYIMNRVAHDGGYTALVTGHNLDDEVAVLMQNTLNWAGGYLARQAPVLAATRPGLARKAKPLCRIYEREMAAYAIVRGIDYIYDECPHAVGSTTLYYKELLNQLEEKRPGAKLQFYLSFLQAKEAGLFSAAASEPDLHACQRCGQPTTAPGECSFCRLWDKVRAVKGLPTRLPASMLQPHVETEP
ncbi:MAG: adenine nucleotide alpha hydrolase family protein [Anaerolineales bacterium]|nr:adenine nucleotide alpha hydrolase family protein [Anaerolineales bacterium]